MNLNSKISIITTFICTAAFLSSCSDKKPPVEKEVQTSSPELSSYQTNTYYEDNDTDQLLPAYQYKKFNNPDQFFSIDTMRSINGTLYSFGSKKTSKRNTFITDIDNLSTTQIDYEFYDCERPIICNNYLYTLCPDYDGEVDNCILTVTDLSNTSDTKQIVLNGIYLSPVTISPNGNIYFFDTLKNNKLYVYNKDLELIKETTYEELGITEIVYDICCDENENICLCSRNSDKTIENNSIYKFDSSFNKIFQGNFKPQIFHGSFFINSNGDICVGTLLYNSNQSKLFCFDSTNGDLLSEYEIPCDCIFLKGTHGYDCTYYTSDNIFYGYKYSDGTSGMLLDNSRNITENQLVMQNTNHLFVTYSYLNTHLLTSCYASNTDYFEAIANEKNERKEFSALKDEEESTIQNSFISSSGDIYFTEESLEFCNKEYQSPVNCKYSVHRITTEGAKSSVNIPLPDDLGLTDMLTVDQNENIFIGKTGYRENEITLNIFDCNGNNIGDASIRNVSELRSFFMFEDYMYIYYCDTQKKNHMVKINSKTKKFEKVNEFENTDFQKIVAGTDEFDLYVIEGTYLHGYSFEKNKYTQFTDNLQTQDVSVENIYPINKERFIIQNKYMSNTNDQCNFMILEKQK